MVLEAFWTCLGGLLRRFLRFLGSRERDKKRARFRSGLRPSWSRPGGLLEPPWRRPGASCRRLGGFLGRPWRYFLPVGAAGSISKWFEAVLESSWRRPGTSWRRLGGFLGRPWRDFLPVGAHVVFVICFRTSWSRLGHHF